METLPIIFKSLDSTMSRCLKRLCFRSALSNSYNDRFFWNKALLTDILEENSSSQNEWIVPICQGYVAQKSLVIDGDDLAPTDLTLTLISRRSSKRAGTRYLRRGIDDEGICFYYSFILNLF